MDPQLMLSLFRTNTRGTTTLEDTILVLLDFMRRKGLRRVAESDLHRLVFSVHALLPARMKFVERPTIYSNELFECLKKLERSRLVDELVYVHDGWVPKHLYEVTRIGQLKALEVEDRIRMLRTIPLQDILDSVIASAEGRQLLPTFDD